MKRNILTLLTSVAFVATMLVSCGKEGLEYSLEDSDWVGSFVFIDAITGEDEDGAPITQQRTDSLACSLTFSASNCRWSGTLWRSVDGGTKNVLSSFDYFGSYNYDTETGKGVFYSDATVLNGGVPFNFTVTDAEELTFEVPANTLHFNLTAEPQMLALLQRSNIPY